MDIKDKQLVAKKRIYIILWILCVFGGMGLLPYIDYLGITPSPTSLSIFLFSTVQSALLFGVICWLSYLVVPRANLRPFSMTTPFRRIIFPGVILGAIVGVVIHILDSILFQNGYFDVHPPFWIGFLSAFYGGVNEEVMMRLFLFSLLYLVMMKLFKFQEEKRLRYLWVTNLVVALIFGLGHLPAAFKIGSIAPIGIVRILLLNAFPSLVFGWLYWSRGLWTAMTAHYITDVMIYVVLL